MKAASNALQTFLFNKEGYVRADLYTFTLPNGGPVLRYSSVDRQIVHAGLTFAAGPCISDQGTTQTRGLGVSTLLIDILSDDRNQVNGVPLVKFIKANGLDGAVILVERMYAPDWGQAEVGSYIRFSGRFSEVQDAGKIGVTVVAASHTELLDTNVPTDLYQASCANTVFDTDCGLLRASFAAAGTVGAGSTTTTVALTNLTTAGQYSLGTIAFTSGANNGLRRTVKAQDGSGNMTLIQPLPVAPSAGDTFTAYPGCDLQQGTCSGKFNNLIRFRGQPYIPAPETAI